MSRPSHRLYVDEIGDASLKVSNDPANRHLSLTSAIVDLDYVRTRLFPAIEQLKETYFGSHPDEPIVLHRSELVGARYPFQALRDANVRASFDADVLALLQDLDYEVITVVIDKLEHKRQYQTWQFDPYHYCLTVLVERYVMWLHGHQALGDVMAESRGGKPDRRLKDAFHGLYNQGSEHMSAVDIQKFLTSNQLKVKPKATNVAGLQLVELVAFPSHASMIAVQTRKELRGAFSQSVVDILVRDKYRRSPTGKIDGYGRKWLP
jgi:hypothetical protein